jgi:outer membrane biogenesis lipoprotein LolB
MMNKYIYIETKNRYFLFLALLLPIILTACAVEVSLTSVLPKDLIDIPTEELARNEVDFVSGELITTGNGYQFKGSFGEISEKKTLTNNYSFEGVFYE